ncbi:MAG TPA: HD domain-containing phosphohydrolase [Candidatus Eisenbacteria bacterium]|jgi:signal transduction histidine kinase
MARQAAKAGPSATELKLRADLDRARRELGRLKKSGAGTGDDDAIRRRSAKLHEILKVISQINADLELGPLLERVAGTIQASLGFRVVFIRLREPGSDRLKAAAFAGLASAIPEALGAEDVRLEHFQSWLREEFRVSRSYFISHKHPFSRTLPRGYAPDLGAREEWEWHPEDVLLVPLVNGSGELLAYLSVDDPVDRRVPSPEVVELLEIFASHAVVAIENARLYQQLAARTRELEEAGRRMKEMHALKSTFVSTISHELRTPLTAIRACVDTLQAAGQDRIGGEQLSQFVSVLDEESLRLSRLIESLLDLSRFDAGQLHPLPKTVDLGEVVEETAGLLGRTAGAGQVDLKVAREVADTHLDADRDQMRQLVLHLASNAIKFTPSGGRVVLRLTGDERELALQVEDTGIGIPADALEKIFDRFYQVDSSLVRRYGGSGLGLAICKSIVEGHHGCLRAKSAPDQGSCFTVTLPRRTERRVIVRPGPTLRAPTEDVLRLGVEMVSEVMNAGVVSLMLQEPDGDLVIQAAIGLEEWVVREARVQIGTGVSGWVARHQRPVCVRPEERSGEVSGSGRSCYRTGTFLSVPLETDEGRVGALNVTDPLSKRPFEVEDCHLLMDLAERVAHAWQQAHSAEVSPSEVGDTADALRRVLEHLRAGRKSAPDRVWLAQAIAHEMRLEDVEVCVIGFAAAVHDVGMTFVSRAILESRRPLTKAQRIEMQQHVEMGAEVLRPLATMGAVRDVVLSHHEWWDGSGYPRGLRGSRIPIGARVLAVVDAFESMIRGRAHRLPKSRETALLEIMELRGTQFDPEAVDALARILPGLDVEPAGEAGTPEHATSDGGR